MDYILSVLDNLILDKIWASVVPAAVFDQQVPWNTTKFPAASSASATWLSMVSHLPHPSPDEFLVKNAEAPMYQTPSFLAQFESPPLVPSAWPRSYIPRQLISISIITLIGIHILYFLFATLSYYFIFDHRMMKHPRFLKNQVRLEIMSSLKAFPGITLLTLPFFQAEVMGYSRLYDDPEKYGWTYLVLSVPLFLLVTDYCIYWIHRWLHHPILYKRLHKPHHKWIIPTPFASHAFHFVDGYAQSFPYHMFIMIFPLHRAVYLVLFVLVNFWSIFIHDSDMITGHALENIINGPAHHTLHHLYFTCNYGQASFILYYFTWADKAGGSYRKPESEHDPLIEILAAEKEKEKEKLGKAQ
ncbi:Lathosterol oxidase; AltName: Full=C-5 sterol desaturase; AltName: Full=Delta(7)-sterol 5-desaturase; AltName: Full=Delta(7)-sterol C5(6)-desaturase; AltName: Full=Lathosterol 5-desaturase; AltName: Full=Sterol-C5-desaturase [Serendipita indica DSM 11827]|nr:Lathosterol oxidase; AltName: Full=C-5 sterol desaturase; AltName: Full=Delta(7)-sterol 5-desaturase; AltName: Full=Delta(7)-sterol C5(6)-desaturase; AltName: Full=Lathosterol 5-desaturase; AltName: Full=Sterol-C5-desaturase [Serendipita indica DSM 11827]